MHEVFLDFYNRSDKCLSGSEIFNIDRRRSSIQRYDRLTIHRKETEDALDLSLSPIYDEAWMA